MGQKYDMQQRKDLIRKAERNNPEIRKARKFILLMFFTLIVIRTVESITLNLAYIYIQTEIGLGRVISLVSIALIVVLFYSIYLGKNNNLYFLIFVGVVAPLLMAINITHVDFVHQNDILRVIIIMIVSIVQIVTMTAILFNENCRKYFGIIKGIDKLSEKSS